MAFLVAQIFCDSHKDVHIMVIITNYKPGAFYLKGIALNIWSVLICHSYKQLVGMNNVYDNNTVSLFTFCIFIYHVYQTQYWKIFDF